MAKLESAAEFEKYLKEGKYESKTNAQRAAGRTRLPESEKKKAFAAIENHFGPDDGAAPAKKASKKAGKKAAKKAAKKVASRPAVDTAPAAAPSDKPGKKAKKKAAAKKKVSSSSKPPPGTLPISPSQVENTGGLLLLIDGTVNKSVSIIDALKRANELSGEGDISQGVLAVKHALIAAAQLLQRNVVAPLHNAGGQADADVTARLEQVVASSSVPFANQTMEMPSGEHTTMPVMPMPGAPLS